MYKKHVIGLEDALKAVNASIKEASKEPSRPISVAVVDDAGELICLQRMNGIGRASGKVTNCMAYNKAYTAVIMNRTTREFGEGMKKMGFELGTMGDPLFTPMPGGLVFKDADGQPVGGIGVSGLLPDEDEQMAYVGLNALKL